MTIADRRPTRLLPLLYLGTAHVSLVLACLFAACWPQAVAGFFYHAWLIGLVHLVTLGWISFSILGTMYIVGPLALQMDMPPRRLDYVAYACALVGLIGMVGHFWIQEYGGMAWSAGTIATGVLYMTVRIALRVREARVQPAVKLHIVLACVNFWIAATMGVLIAVDKVAHFLPGFILSNVFAHAHLAAIGWATMMVVGVGYRLLPMTFPSKLPSGRSLFASAVLLEVGVLGLFTTLLLQIVWMLLFGLLIVAGLVVFMTHVVWMWRHQAAKPPGLHGIQFGLPRGECGRLNARGRHARRHAAGCPRVGTQPSDGGGLWRRRPDRLPGADGRRHGDSSVADGQLVLGVRGQRLSRATALTARDARPCAPGPRVRRVDDRRTRAGDRHVGGVGTARQRRRCSSVPPSRRSMTSSSSLRPCAHAQSSQDRRPDDLRWRNDAGSSRTDDEHLSRWLDRSRRL
jgi:hypothetical protein